MDGGEGGGEALGVRSEQLEQGGLIELVVAEAQDLDGALLQGLGAPDVVLGLVGVVMRGPRLARGPGGARRSRSRR